MQNDTRIAVDVAKSVFEIAVSDRPGRVTLRKRLHRGEFLMFFAQQPVATVVMEACGSAHYWGRWIEELGHRVVLLPPHQVRPYVRRNKTDRNDALGILEASRNEDIRPVPVKTVVQQVLTSLHRLRSAWMSERTARLNTVRGLAILHLTGEVQIRLVGRRGRPYRISGVRPVFLAMRESIRGPISSPS